MDAPRIVVTKSTVPVGTTRKVAGAIRAEQQSRGVDIPFEVVSNPEFLKEGSAVADFQKPDRIGNSLREKPAATALPSLGPDAPGDALCRFEAPQLKAVNHRLAGALMHSKAGFKHHTHPGPAARAAGGPGRGAVGFQLKHWR